VTLHYDSLLAKLIVHAENRPAAIRRLVRALDELVITGVATNVCCESTGRDCMMRGFRTIMVSDANASFSEAEHEAALLNFITYFGDVQSTEDVVARLAVQAPAAEVA